jgi:hypothetical protein
LAQAFFKILDSVAPFPWAAAKLRRTCAGSAAPAAAMWAMWALESGVRRALELTGCGLLGLVLGLSFRFIPPRLVARRRLTDGRDAASNNRRPKQERSLQPNTIAYSAAAAWLGAGRLQKVAEEEVQPDWFKQIDIASERQLDWMFEQLDIASRGALSQEETQALFMVIDLDDVPSKTVFNEFAGVSELVDRGEFGLLVESLQAAVGRTIDDIYTACQS